ncbi:MAG: hypothetical protein UV73_C0004G0070 [Candidatus Gottesmanbacteria bacterium GW2011_GWA2_43_14]|uniref:Hexokinase n=1 Tax=Candidatus Gottesmanbacteria bacterium GW2011_GWA2_43_14 TaxID=1618443 RepID=A0A0G1GGJ5_9BACT|nr:MAG: hypothetical protein UV73_C0004G0070 [Candidatus Gottesmanbacteria bacterium GW2011_GWA2_43_14]
MPDPESFNGKLNKLLPLLNQNDLLKAARLFKIDLIAALSNQQSSLPTILNPVNKIYPRKGSGIAISVGGTYGYVSYFNITQKGIIRFFNRKKFDIPLMLTKKELFDLLAKELFFVAKNKTEIGPVGISFAYALQPLLHQGVLDGKLLEMSKDRNIKGLVGEMVGWEFRQFLRSKYNIKTKVSVANDAISLLIGGGGIEVAGVIGTGLNFVYWEKRSAIAPMKLNCLFGFSQNEVAVNIEASNFNKIPATTLREKVDKKSIDSGSALAEKEVSGAYLYKIFNAGKDELLGKNFPTLNSTDQLDSIRTGSYDFSGENKNSAGDAANFADRIFQRSAQIVAIELCGIFLKLKKSKGLIPVIIDGGLFWNVKNYPALVNLYVNMIMPEAIPSFTRLFGSSRRGIAILAVNQNF